MIKNMIQRKGTNAFLISSMKRSFAALSESSINLASTSPADVHDSDPRAVGALMAAMAMSPKSVNEVAICDEIDEYFRLKFRKVSFEDAKSIISGMGFDPSVKTTESPSKIPGLDNKFWVWETLEEATRPHVDELSKEEIETFFTAWAL